MPRYEFLCHNCKKLFSKVLSLVDYEEGDVLCPHCGSKEGEQCSLQPTLWGVRNRYAYLFGAHVEEKRLKQ